MQNEEKKKSAKDLILTNSMLAYHNKEKKKIAAELISSNGKPAFQNIETQKCASELIVAGFQPNERQLKNGITTHVSEKTLAEEKFPETSLSLQVELDKLNKIMESSLDMICTIDGEGKFVTVSSASKHMLGYDPGELEGKKYIDLVFEGDVEKTMQTAAGVILGVAVTIFENRYLHKNKSIVPLIWSAKWDDNDNLMYCIAKDVTEKKTLEKASDNERQRFLDLFTQAPTSMGILKGPGHIFEMVNPLYLELTGKKNIIGKPLVEVMPELSDQGFTDLLDAVYKTGKTFSANEMAIQLDQHNNGELVQKYLNFIYKAYRTAEGNIEGIFFFAIDVTEQVLSRKKIEESENRFQAIIEKSTEMITLSTEDGIVLYASPSITKVFGYTLEEINHVSVFDFIHPGDINTFISERKKILQTEGSSFKNQIRVRHKNKSWVWCEATLTNMLHEPGVSAMVSNFRDISEKKRVEIKQEFDKNNLNALINNTNDLLWSVDTDFRLITANQPFDAMSVANFGETIAKGGNVLAVSYSPEMLNHFKMRYERAFAGEEFTEIEHFHVPFEFWTEISYYPIRNGDQVVGTACHSRDITERKKAEISLAQSEKRYRRIIETAQEGVWMIDEDNKTTFVNKKMCDILGYTQDEMIGRTNLSFKDEEEQKKALEQLERRRQGISETHDARYVMKSGKEIWGHVSTNPIFAEDKTYRGALAMITDITERKYAEIRMKDLNENLEMQTKKLAVSNEELERFAYVTSHDLQEPLRMVTSFLQLLQNKYDSQLDETAHKYIDFAVDGAARMKILILDLLEFSRISSFAEDHTIINLNDVITKTRHALKPVIEASQAEINVSFLPKVCGNESQLMQLFQNLLSNGIKYKAGHQPVIHIDYTETPGEWVFCVSDNGIGIDEKFFEKIFIIFQRLHNKKEYEGTGIGLAICKKIVELHGGKIWVESSKGKGSQFYFTILKVQRSESNVSQVLCPDLIANTSKPLKNPEYH